VRREAIELVLPEAPIRVEPRRRLAHRSRQEPHATHAALPPPFDQVRPFEHGEVLADGRERHGERPRQLQHRGLPRREPRDDRATRGVRQGAEHPIERRF
jgi:hypothetical protein